VNIWKVRISDETEERLKEQDISVERFEDKNAIIGIKLSWYKKS